MSRRLSTLLAAISLAMITILGVASPAAAVTPAEKLSVLSQWTQTSATSYNAWNAARNNRAPWAAYNFDWSTDYCSSSPDNPLGFNFSRSCNRHDLGYRNYKAMGRFSANKSRVDSAFYEDLKRACAGYGSVVRPACLSLAWTYYQAVRVFGRVEVSQTDLDRAAKMKSDAVRLAATS